jgi:hypothetical protein
LIIRSSIDDLENFAINMKQGNQRPTNTYEVNEESHRVYSQINLMVIDEGELYRVPWELGRGFDEEITPSKPHIAVLSL